MLVVGVLAGFALFVLKHIWLWPDEVEKTGMTIGLVSLLALFFFGVWFDLIKR